MSRRRMMMLQQTTKTRPELEVIEGNITLCTIGTRNFIKVNEDLTICAIIYSNKYQLPLLVSEIKEAVTYRTTPIEGIFHSLTSIDYEGKKYYISNNQYAMNQSNIITYNPYHLPILNEVLNKSAYENTALGQQQAARDLLDYYFGKI